ncbi:type VI secretion system tip protein VgrG [Citrobacter braakii]|uniref:type VI secretion system tip protein VgrG n=1 Tax=Citrobacter braakii TaxID=57706 RepID=UPI0011ED24EA|nr:type VI secretion system Vgr family protein [Citrobacter braakii]
MQNNVRGPNPYQLTINDSTLRADVLRFRGTEALSRPFSWRIEFTTSGTVSAETVLLKSARFSLRHYKVLQGVITKLEWLSTNADQSHYAVTLGSRLALLSRSRRCAIYQNVTVPELVAQILRSHGLEGPDFEFQLTGDYPVRELITQWQETDLAFVQRILAEVGIWYRQTMHDVTGLDVTVFGDSQRQYLPEQPLPYHEPSGLYDGAELCCWGLRTWHNVATGNVSVRDYNPRTAREPMDAAVSVRAAGVTTGGHYRDSESYLHPGEGTAPPPETGGFYARIRHERELNTSAYLHLFSNAYWLSPGQVVNPVGAGLHDLNEGVLVTFASFRGARDSRLYVSLWGMPYREGYGFRPAECPRPHITGTLPGRVESVTPYDRYAHIDSTGRYRVRMDFYPDEGEPGYAYPWLRRASPCAGEEYGWHMPLTDGTEVGVAFHGGNPDRPYIAHAFHDSEHPDIVNADNRSQNILRTGGGNELRMEDQREQEHIALTTPYGATQLNQGKITDAQRQPRGTGFELRTDEYGVIRVAKGLLVTADGQNKAVGEVLDQADALREIDVCLQQRQQLDIAAEQAQALQSDITAQVQMSETRLQALDRILHLSAPEGIALTSGEHLQLAAADSVALSAGADIRLGVTGAMTAVAGEQLGLFAHRGAMRLQSGEGPVVVQAQHGSMQLLAQARLSLSSGDDITLSGKKRITLIGGGSYLTLEEGKIEYGSTQSYIRKMKKTMLAGSVSEISNFSVNNENSTSSFSEPSASESFPEQCSGRDEHQTGTLESGLLNENNVDTSDSVAVPVNEQEQYYYHLSNGNYLDSFLEKGFIPQGGNGPTLSASDFNKRVFGYVNYLNKKTIESVKKKPECKSWRADRIKLSAAYWEWLADKFMDANLLNEDDKDEYESKYLQCLLASLTGIRKEHYVQCADKITDSERYDEITASAVMPFLNKRAKLVQMAEYNNTLGYIYMTENKKTLEKYLNLSKELEFFVILVIAKGALDESKIMRDDQEPDGAVKYKGSVASDRLMFVRKNNSFSVVVEQIKNEFLLPREYVLSFIKS